MPSNTSPFGSFSGATSTEPQMLLELQIANRMLYQLLLGYQPGISDDPDVLRTLPGEFPASTPAP